MWRNRARGARWIGYEGKTGRILQLKVLVNFYSILKQHGNKLARKCGGSAETQRWQCYLVQIVLDIYFVWYFMCYSCYLLVGGIILCGTRILSLWIKELPSWYYNSDPYWYPEVWFVYSMGYLVNIFHLRIHTVGLSSVTHSWQSWCFG